MPVSILSAGFSKSPFYKRQLPTHPPMSATFTNTNRTRHWSSSQKDNLMDNGLQTFHYTNSGARVLNNSARYKTELCRPFEESGDCKYGEKCQFAHGSHELRGLTRHPKYKTERCRTFHSQGLCPYGPRCHFIHNDSECDIRGKNNNCKVFSQTFSSAVLPNNHGLPCLPDLSLGECILQHNGLVPSPTNLSPRFVPDVGVFNASSQMVNGVMPMTMDSDMFHFLNNVQDLSAIVLGKETFDYHSLEYDTPNTLHTDNVYANHSLMASDEFQCSNGASLWQRLLLTTSPVSNSVSNSDNDDNMGSRSSSPLDSILPLFGKLAT